MNEEQAWRIMVGGFVIAMIPTIKFLICRFLGDDYEGERSWRYALGKMVGHTIGSIRRYL